MKPSLLAAAALSFLALALLALFFLLRGGTQKNPPDGHTPDAATGPAAAGRACIVVAELNDAAGALSAPSPGNPVYYIAHSMGQRDAGDAYGGAKQTPYASIQKQLADALASNGYLPAGAAHPAAQVLILTWGMHNKIEMPGATPTGGATGDEATAFVVYSNLLSRAQIVGGKKFADAYGQALLKNNLRQFTARDDLTKALDNEIWNDCGYLLVISLDARALLRNERKILWKATISTIPQEASMEATLPILLNAAANFFARETFGPTIVLNPYESGQDEHKR